VVIVSVSFYLDLTVKAHRMAYQVGHSLLEFLHVDVIAFSLLLRGLLLDLGWPRATGYSWGNHFSALSSGT
jgi:hypothetical protein